MGCLGLMFWVFGIGAGSGFMGFKKGLQGLGPRDLGGGGGGRASGLGFRG